RTEVASPVGGPMSIRWMCKDAAGRTALGYAVNRRSVALARILLEGGADPNASFHDGGEYWSISNRPKSRLPDWFAGRPAEDQVDTDSTSALAMAVRGFDEDMAVILLEFGANPFQPDGDGKTPMLLAEDPGAAKIRQILQRAKW